MEIDKYDILKKTNHAAFELERRIVNKEMSNLEYFKILVGLFKQVRFFCLLHTYIIFNFLIQVKVGSYLNFLYSCLVCKLKCKR